MLPLLPDLPQALNVSTGAPDDATDAQHSWSFPSSHNGMVMASKQLSLPRFQIVLLTATDVISGFHLFSRMPPLYWARAFRQHTLTRASPTNMVLPLAPLGRHHLTPSTSIPGHRDIFFSPLRCAIRGGEGLI